MSTKRARAVLPSEQMQREETRISELLRLTDAATAHEQAIEVFERKIGEHEATISALDGLFEAARAVPPFVTGYAESLSGNRVFGGNMSSRTTIHDTRQHCSHVAATGKAAIEVRLKDVREQLVIARQNLVGINEALAALEQEAA